MRRLVIGAFFLAFAVFAQAEDQKWTLTDGRTVTVIKVLSQNATHVTVRCPDGIQQVDKRQLPEELKAQFPYDEEAVEAQRAAEEAAKAQAAKATERQNAPERQRQAQRQSQPASGGLAIEGVRPNGRATAVVTVVNRTDKLTEVTRDLFMGVNVNGTAFPASRIRNAQGDIWVRLRIGPNSTKEVTVEFAIPEGEVGDIRAVYWRQ